MRNYFTFDSQQSTTYGVYISGSGVFNSPTRNYDELTIPGRDGALLGYQKELENVDLVYPAFIYSDFKNKVASLKEMLLSRTGYKKLTDTYNPDEFRMAYFPGGLDVDPTQSLDAGSFDIKFRCKPQRFLTSGESETTFTAAGTISNPTAFSSSPRIRVYGYGTLTVNSDNITVASGNTYVDIDSDIMDCYTGLSNANGKVTFSSNDFPVLKPGSNSISFSGNITKVVIKPRWWRL